ncbi:hypothetical protein CAPTEDRAFT_194964 [Capitella teleta]|uniref:CCHC-type domain-containing protein n=1 Tax=Capitella teleta TaxID=283909 RepID=R7VGU2_CAPTE|nr:hypothetical protein CAPTEDRAFT_194964 [Capitella teleta]|eukprot:ELU17824.1 hypothetical protein CAPTEDRAFT_194964 [Capitella teleta]
MALHSRSDCVVCGRGGHLVERCYNISNVPVEQRKDNLKRCGLCFKCLSSGKGHSLRHLAVCVVEDITRLALKTAFPSLQNLLTPAAFDLALTLVQHKHVIAARQFLGLVLDHDLFHPRWTQQYNPLPQIYQDKIWQHTYLKDSIYLHNLRANDDVYDDAQMTNHCIISRSILSVILKNLIEIKHTLQLVIHDALDKQRTIKIVGHFRHSHKACKELKNYQEQLPLPVHNVVQGMPTRKEDFTEFTDSEVFPRKYCGHHRLENQPVVERALEVWKDLSKYLQKASQSSDSHESLRAAQKDHFTLPHLHFFLSICKIFSPFMLKYQTDRPLIPFLSRDLKALLKGLLRRQSDKIFGGTYAVAPSTSEDVASTLNQQLLKKAREEESLNTDIDKEIAAYLAMASMYTESALLFWNENMASLSSLPQLSCLARIYLCLSAESVPVE